MSNHQTYWQTITAIRKVGYGPRFTQLQQDAEHGDGMARATLVSGIQRDDGRYDLYLEPVPYTTQAPGVPTPARHSRPTIAAGSPKDNLNCNVIQALESDLGLAVCTSIRWKAGGDSRLQQRALESLALSAHVRSEEQAHRPLEFLGTYSFIETIADQLHRHKLHVMGNDAYFRYWFLAPLVDIPGGNTRGLRKASSHPYRPALSLLPSMAPKRPYIC